MTTRPTTLVVEDDGAIREALSELLETLGHEVTAVATAEEGLERLRAHCFLLLLTDYALPGESGGWLIAQARAEGLLRQTRVVVVTALLELPDIQHASILRKPLELDALLAITELPQPHPPWLRSVGGS